MEVSGSFFFILKEALKTFKKLLIHPQGNSKTFKKHLFQ